MADDIAPAEITAAVKMRIIRHMNNDHADSLSFYLQYYCHIPDKYANTARLSQITLNHMVISSSFGRNIVLLDPPMKSWSEARERLADMHHICASGLGLSDIAITQYRSPRGLQLLSFIVCAWSFLSFSTRRNFTPQTGWIFYKFWATLGLANFSYRIQPFVITFMLVVHFGEVVMLATPRLKKYGVPAFSPLWWKWIISNFVEGYGAILRMDALVDEERIANKMQKH